MEQSGADRTPRARFACRPAPDADGTPVLGLGESAHLRDALRPATAYEVRLGLGAGTIGSARFRTPAESNAPTADVTLAFSSCFQPFQRDGRPASGPFEHHFRYGPVAGFAFDLRSRRRFEPGGDLLGEEQLERFARFVQEQANTSVIVIVPSEPFLAPPPGSSLSRPTPRVRV